MKKIFTLVVISLFISSLAFAIPQPVTDNYTILNKSGGATGITPPVEIMLVRNAEKGDKGMSTSLTSGDVVVFDTNSADGFTVSRCVADLDASYAGVLVTAVLTPEQTQGATLRPGVQRNWGYAAVRGYCLAKTDSTGASAGNGLVANGATLEGSFVCKGDRDISCDRGVLLATGATDAAVPVWLR